MNDYDSTADTLRHSRRVGELMSQMITELVDRSYRHDLSKTETPEKEIFDLVTPRLRELTYGSDEYKASLASMGNALEHHYANNRHHPEWHSEGVAGMTLMDLAEMLADWKAAGERHSDGSMAASLRIQRKRFDLSDQLYSVLANTAKHLGWIDKSEERTG